MSILAGIIAAVALVAFLYHREGDLSEHTAIPSLFLGVAVWWITERLFGW